MIYNWISFCLCHYECSQKSVHEAKTYPVDLPHTFLEENEILITIELTSSSARISKILTCEFITFLGKFYYNISHILAVIFSANWKIPQEWQVNPQNSERVSVALSQIVTWELTTQKKCCADFYTMGDEWCTQLTNEIDQMNSLRFL